MTQIFISYASEDRDHAKALAQVLEGFGFSTWWDRKIPFGKAYDEVIAESLAAAKCVLVLWTGTSVESRWVRSEASEAAAREVLIPVLLETGVRIPLEFRLLQAADLSGWQGETDYPELKALITQIEAGLASNVAPASDQRDAAAREAARDRKSNVAALAGAGKPRTMRSKWLQLFGFIVLPSILILAAAALAMAWRIPTRAQLDIVVNRVTFTLGGNRPVDVPANALSFVLLSIENFDKVTFTAKRMLLQRDAADHSAAWRELATNRAIVLGGRRDERPLLTVESIAGRSDTPSAGRLQPLSAHPGTRITLEARSGAVPRVMIRMDGQDLQTNLLPDSAVRLSASHATVESMDRSVTGDGDIALQVVLPADQPIMQLQGGRRFFVMTAGLPANRPVVLLDRADVTEIEFLRQAADGSITSAVVAAGELSYPDRSGIARKTLAAGEFVGLGDLDAAAITRLELQPKTAGMQLRFEGIAGKLDVSSGGAKQDMRVSALDALWHNAQAAVLLSIAVWAVAVGTGAYRLYRDFVAA